MQVCKINTFHCHIDNAVHDSAPPGVLFFYKQSDFIVKILKFDDKEIVNNKRILIKTYHIDQLYSIHQ